MKTEKKLIFTIFKTPVQTLNEVSLNMIAGFYHEFIPAEKMERK
jgi:hypothetical protein